MKLPGKIAVMGGGSWATAIAKIVLSKTETINWYMRRDDRIADFKRLGHNPAYLTSVKFDVKRINFSSNIISAIKGIVPDENLIVSEYFTEEYNVPPENIAVIAGPCHAEEVALERLSYLTFACPDTNKAKVVAERFASSYIKTSVSNDVVGIEYGSVLKNVYAIAAGICNGLKYGDNFQAVLMSNAVQEMNRFLTTVHPLDRNVYDSAYLGDLLVTTAQSASRRSTGTTT